MLILVRWANCVHINLHNTEIVKVKTEAMKKSGWITRSYNLKQLNKKDNYYFKYNKAAIRQRFIIFWFLFDDTVDQTWDVRF